MTTERKTHLATISALILIAGAAFLWKRTSSSAQTPPTPQDAVYTMLDAARRGDVPKYLASYTGALAESLRQSAGESTEAGFARYLRDSNSSLKGVAAGEPQSVSETEVTVRVEYVYQDRNEAQTMRLQKVDGAWKIAAVEAADRVKTLVPYGTPIK